MAIKTDLTYKGINIADGYLKIASINNRGDKILLDLELYSMPDGDKNGIVGSIQVELDDIDTKILSKAYQALKTQKFTTGLDI